jgi:hypothetical protein
MNPQRSVGLVALQPLWRIPGIRWYSLQVASPAGDINHAPAQSIKDFSSLLTDFAETAAAICHLDLVISVNGGSPPRWRARPPGLGAANGGAGLALAAWSR